MAERWIINADGPTPLVLPLTPQDGTVRVTASEVIGVEVLPPLIAALREVADLEIVNAGGTGSIEETARDRSITDIAAGSGLFGGHLFDGYRRFRPAPAPGRSASSRRA